MRPEVDKLLLALQVDYMGNPDRFVRRLFGLPLNTPRVNMKAVQQLRYVGESTFFDTMRQVLRAKEPVDKVRSHADVKMENELIWSLFQLLVEHVPPRWFLAFAYLRFRPLEVSMLQFTGASPDVLLHLD